MLPKADPTCCDAVPFTADVARLQSIGLAQVAGELIDLKEPSEQNVP